MTSAARRSTRRRPDTLAPDAAIERARARLAVGADVDPQMLSGRAARALRLARTVGAPALPILDAVAAALDDDRERHRAVAVATAQARTVRRGLLAMPVVLVLGAGSLLELPLAAFYGGPHGPMVATTAAILVALGWLAATLLTRRATRPPAGADLDELSELVAAGLSAGLPPPAALRAVAEVRPDRGAPLRRAALGIELGGGVAGAPADLAPLLAVLTDADRLGSPAVPALRRLAADQRSAARNAALMAAERLPAQLVFPTVLLLLPASVLTIGAPLVAIGLAAAGGAAP